jgi:Holliday junction DNA helicase RuvA
VHLLTHLAVREDAHVLYGFATEEERRLFRTLIKVSGVGPKIALALLSGISVEGFAQCVQNQDAAALTRVPGIGRKTAERLLVEMRDRLASVDSSQGSVTLPAMASPARLWRSDTVPRKRHACSRLSVPVHTPPRS